MADDFKHNTSIIRYEIMTTLGCHLVVLGIHDILVYLLFLIFITVQYEDDTV